MTKKKEVESLVSKVVSNAVSKAKDVSTKEESSVLNETIISLRVYQAVTFDGASESSFNVAGTQRKKPVEVRIIGNYAGVEIKSKTDHIFVPMTNVSGIYFENAKSKQKRLAAQEEKSKIQAINASKVDTASRPR